MGRFWGQAKRWQPKTFTHDEERRTMSSVEGVAPQSDREKDYKRIDWFEWVIISQVLSAMSGERTLVSECFDLEANHNKG